MTGARLRKLLTPGNMLTLATSAATATGAALYGAYKNNNFKQQAEDIAVQLAALGENATAIAASARQLGNEAFTSSRLQGIVCDAALCILAAPSFFSSLDHAPKRGDIEYLQFLCQNWDHYLGRGLQLGGIALAGQALRLDGSGNPQYATAFAGTAPVVLGAGTYFVERNRARQLPAEHKEPLLSVATEQVRIAPQK